MGTSFDEVIDIATLKINDYSLKKLYENSKKGFETFCDGLLIVAIPNFTLCKQDLTYDKKNRCFNATLSISEVSILADLWCMAWMSREVDNKAQFQGKLQSSGSFKNHSEAQNLKEKTIRLDKMREQVYQKITDYLLEDISNITI